MRETTIACPVLAMLVMASVSRAAGGPFPVVMTYRLPADSGYQYEFRGNALHLVPFGAEAKIMRGKDGVLMAPTPPRDFRDCSSPAVGCLVSDRYVFAVPRGKLSSGLSIEVAGARIKVAGCMPASDKSCAVAVLDSRRHSDPDASRLVYIFDSNRGIIAFQEASGWPEPLDVSRWTLDSIGTEADMYALVEPTGLLAPNEH